MHRFLLALTAAATFAAVAPAHFVFVVPDAAGGKLTVVLSEDLNPDEEVGTDQLAGLKLMARDAAGADAPVPVTVGKHALTATLPGGGPRVVFGSVVYGVMDKGKTPYLLAYHPKAVVGVVPTAAVGEKAVPAELVPVASGSGVRFRFVAGGKPVADTEVTVLKPDGGKGKAKTDADGLTPAFPAAGRYGAWAKTVVARSGEHGGKKYDEARHYATLVVDVPAK